MTDRLVYSDSTRRVYVTAEQVGQTSPQATRTEWADPTVAQLTNAVAVLRQWAADADAVTVTSGNAVATLATVVDRLGVFFDRFADLLEDTYR